MNGQATMSQPALTAEKVNAIFNDCCFQEREADPVRVVVRDGVHSVDFHPGRLRAHEREIIELLGELPDQFKKSGSKGWNFYNTCQNRHGRMWTGSHFITKQLLILGIAIGKVERQTHKVERQTHLDTDGLSTECRIPTMPLMRNISVISTEQTLLSQQFYTAALFLFKFYSKIPLIYKLKTIYRTGLYS